MNNERIRYYIRRFEEVYDGSPWYGDPVMAKLKDVTPAEAFKQPHEGVHAVAEIVAHMIYWRRALISRLEGDTSFKASMKSKDNWPPLEQLKKTGWPAIQTSLAASQQKITTLLAGQTDDFLAQPYSENYIFDQLVGSIIEHDIYHLGQIALVKKMMA